MTIEILAQDLRAAQQDVVDSLAGASDVELHSPPAPGEWTASEVVAHVIEMQPMWMAKIANAGHESDLARSHSEIERRTDSVDTHSGDDIDTIMRRLAESNDETSRILQCMSSSDLEVPVTYGHGASSGLAREAMRSLVIGHLSEHARQIAETRRAAGGTSASS